MASFDTEGFVTATIDSLDQINENVCYGPLFEYERLFTFIKNLSLADNNSAKFYHNRMCGLETPAEMQLTESALGVPHSAL